MGKLNAAAFAAFVKQRAEKHDGYIMGSRGQDPKKWAKNSWWFTQYTGKQKKQPLKWREQSAGRRPEDKKEEKVSLDIDLLSFDDRVLKPEDLKREYVVKGLEELKYNQI